MAGLISGGLGPQERSHELERLLPRDPSLKAPAAPRFVHPGGAHDDQFAGLDQPLRVLGGIAATHADGERLGDRCHKL